MTVMNDRSVDIGPFVPQEDDDILICRCEEISKGEIRQAVHDGIRTMEEMRRYLRNGMGLCQGQTCGNGDYIHLCNSRSGRGIDYVRPDRRYEQRTHRTGRYRS